MKPSSVVRAWRSEPGVASCGRQRPRLCGRARSRASDRKASARVWVPSRSTAISWARNIEREVRRSSPSSQTSHRVARPSKRRISRPWPSTAVRYQTSEPCSGVGAASDHSPAARNAPAAVPGTGAAMKPGSPSMSPGCVQAPGAVTIISHGPSRARSTVRRTAMVSPEAVFACSKAPKRSPSGRGKEGAGFPLSPRAGRGGTRTLLVRRMALSVCRAPLRGLGSARSADRARHPAASARSRAWNTAA